MPPSSVQPQLPPTPPTQFSTNSPYLSLSAAMGGLCSKSANEADPFAQPGRVLGTSSQPASAPPPRKLTSSTPGRTLGGNENPDSTRAAEDARSAAARAAEVLDRCYVQHIHFSTFCMPIENTTYRICEAVLVLVFNS